MDYSTLSSNITRNTEMTTAEIWGYGFLFVTIINLSTVMGILFFPLKDKQIYWTVMRVMVGLAIGSLSGSALFHLIPKALQQKAPDEHLLSLGFVWLSIWIVMLLESSMKIGLQQQQEEELHEIPEDQGSVTGSSGTTPNSTSTLEKDIKETEIEAIPLEEPSEKKPPDSTEDINTKMSFGMPPIYHSTFSLNKNIVEQYRTEDGKPKAAKKAIKTVAWVVIFGDGIHNFVDGMSIGAAFSQDFYTGAAICLAIICEEFPHELGDFAILINAGLSVKKALLFNFLSGMTCYMGLVLGILLGKGFDWSYYIFAIAAGIFLYVALADMVPEVSQVIEEVSHVSRKKAWRILLTHHLGVAVGITILFVLAKYMPE